MSDESLITDFLGDSELPAEVDGLLDWVEVELVILSPWIQLTGHQEDLLKVKITDGLNVTLLTQQPLPNNVEHGETVERFQQLGASVYFDNKLHAKMVLADRSVELVMSSNTELRYLILEDCQALIFSEIFSLVSLLLKGLETRVILKSYRTKLRRTG